MLCRCCKYEIENGKATCPVCGFPTLGDAGTEMPAYISDHTKKTLAGISIHVKAYEYQVDDTTSEVMSETSYIKLANAAELEMEKVTWLDREFEKFESDREITLDIRICRQDGDNMDSSVAFKPNKVISHSAIGVSLDAGFKIRFAIGDRNEYLQTDPVLIMNTK